MSMKKPIPIQAPKTGRKSFDEVFATYAARRDSTGLDWRKVSGTSLKTAILAVHSQDMAIMLSPATGGLGICVSLYQNREKRQEYFMVADELNVYLEWIIDTFSNSGEDVRQAMAGGEV